MILQRIISFKFEPNNLLKNSTEMYKLYALYELKAEITQPSNKIAPVLREPYRTPNHHLVSFSWNHFFLQKPLMRGYIY